MVVPVVSSDTQKARRGMGVLFGTVHGTGEACYERRVRSLKHYLDVKWRHSVFMRVGGNVLAVRC